MPDPVPSAPAVADVDDTYAESFRSSYAEIRITARDRTWLGHAVRACTGTAAGAILCDCEAGFDRHVDAAETPDPRRSTALKNVCFPSLAKCR